MLRAHGQSPARDILAVLFVRRALTVKTLFSLTGVHYLSKHHFSRRLFVTSIIFNGTVKRPAMMCKHRQHSQYSEPTSSASYLSSVPCARTSFTGHYCLITCDCIKHDSLLFYAAFVVQPDIVHLDQKCNSALASDVLSAVRETAPYQQRDMLLRAGSDAHLSGKHSTFHWLV